MRLSKYNIKLYRFLEKIALVYVWISLCNPAVTLYALHEADSLQWSGERIDRLITHGTDILETHPDSSILIFKEVIAQSRSINYRQGNIKGILRIGNAFLSKGNNDSAAYIFKLVVLICNSSPEEQRLKQVAYNNLGLVYRLEQPYKALRYYMAAANTASQAINDSGMHLASIYINIGSLFQSLHEPKKNLYYIEKAEPILRSISRQRELGILLNNKALALMDIGVTTYDSLLTILKEALGLSRNTEDFDNECLVLNNIGEIYQKKSEPDKAIYWLLKANKIRHASLYPRSIAMLSLSKAYLLTSNYRLAEYHALEALGLKVKNSDFRAHKILSAIYGASGDYHKAWVNEQAFSTLRENTLNEENNRSINRLETEYRTVQKDRELAQNQLLITRQQIRIEQKNVLLIAFIMGSMSLAAILILFYKNNRHRQYLQEEKIRVLIQEQENSLLKAMIEGEERERMRIGIELHDGVGGLLSAIKLNVRTLYMLRSDLTVKAPLEKIAQLADEASGTLRETAHNLMPEILLKGGIENAVKHFCRHIPQEHIARVEILVYGNMPRFETTFELTVYRIIQELVQNIIKHAKASHAIIQLNLNEKIFSITVEDNGIGITEKSLKNESGMGLKNIQTRVRSLGGVIEFESSGSGTTIYIEFNIDQTKNRSLL